MTKHYHQVFVCFEDDEHYVSACYFFGFKPASGWWDLEQWIDEMNAN